MQTFPRCHEWRYQKNIESFVQIIHTIQRKIGKNSVGKIIGTIRKELNYDKYISNELATGVDDSKVENLDSFQEQASQYTDVTVFLKSIENLIRSKEDKVNKKTFGEVKGVTISTIHKAKGAEKEVVFCVGFSDTMLPHARGNESEELRLAYVAMTRAISELYVSSILNHHSKRVDVSDFVYNFMDKKIVDIKIQQCLDGELNN
jgi:DNA helicase-2/ATP-dependent DNA helicase PcrA